MLGGLLIGGVELVHPLIAFGIVAHQDLDKARLEIGDMLGTAVAVSNSGPSWPLFSAGAQVIWPFAPRVTQDRGFELLVDQDPCRLAQQALGVAAGTTGQVVICLKALIGASYLINRCLRSRSR
jgi:hypothetical protein